MNILRKGSSGRIRQPRAGIPGSLGRSCFHAQEISHSITSPQDLNCAREENGTTERAPKCKFPVLRRVELKWF
ncbi:unnamed protein product [Litomosoides sigmodontis]|uniref:Uncharacterized protein n=1 Tax=Litomosoides sigmodontis TaxID=42156 RepID=A0A3P6TQ77_LITSI|nr:unnamed protein product [Litomosoides sigmodontis]